MNGNVILLLASGALLGAFIIEQFSRKLRIPSVILLLVSGLLLRVLGDNLGLNIPYTAELLPAVGTIGLILIVLEGSLDLELNRKKTKLIKRTVLSAVIGIVVSGGAIAAFIHYAFDLPWLMSWVTALPFSVISSAVAIPSVAGLSKYPKEFVIYESSFSDILGVLAFSLVTSSYGVDFTGIALFTGNFILTCLGAIMVALGLIWYLDKVEHHVKFLPVMAAMVLIYSFAKVYHLSPLILILVFGLALSNTQLYLRGPLLKYFRATRMQDDLNHFRGIGAEAVFLVKSVFFILFGYTIEVKGLFESENLINGLIISSLIILVRFIKIRIILKERREILFFGPRGLITVLLFLSVPPLYSTPAINPGVVTWVVLITILFMLPGSLTAKKEKSTEIL